MIWGLQPGPLLFTEQKDFVWGLIASMYIGNVVGLIIVLTCVPLFASILRIPFSVIAPVIMVICAIGAYTVHNNTFDVVMMLVFGVAGYFMKKTNYPLAPMVLAIVLGDKAEEGVPAIAARLAGRPRGVLLQRSGLHDHGARPDRAVLVGDPTRLHAVLRQQEAAAGRIGRRNRPQGRLAAVPGSGILYTSHEWSEFPHRPSAFPPRRRAGGG